MDESEEYNKLKDYALYLLSIRPRSEREIAGKLETYSIRHNISSNDIEKVIERLIFLDFLNDEKFALWLIDQRRTGKPKGKEGIKRELISKGISKEIIEKILISDSDTTEEEYGRAKGLADKKLNLWKNVPKIKLKDKIIRLLMSRGFDWDTIYRVIDYAVKKI